MKHVLIILTVPVEFSDSAKAVMRDCVYQANLITTKYSKKLQFITERKLLFQILTFLLSKLKVRNYFVSKLFINNDVFLCFISFNNSPDSW